MTTPDTTFLDDLPMPYSVLFVPAAGGWAVTAEGPTALPMGVVVVQFTWSGLEGVRFLLRQNRADGTTNNTEYINVLDPVSRITPRASTPIELTIGVPTEVFVQGRSPFSSILPGDPKRIGMTVIPMGQHTTL